MSADNHPYDVLGVGYRSCPRADPRWLATLYHHLVGCATIANIGAGTGSYELGTCVVAVEPSRLMIRNRDSPAPVVQGRAEALPLRSNAVDACIAIMTVQHWDDFALGLAEMRRVSTRRIVLLTYLPGCGTSSWLSEDYFPELDAMNDDRFPHLSAYRKPLGEPIYVDVAPIPSDCHDGFVDAYWSRPESYLDPEVRCASSSLRAIEGSRGLRRLKSELSSGEWDSKYGHLRAAPAIDLGYRWIVW